MLGLAETPSSKWELPPIVTPNGERFGPRHRPHPGRIDPGGWHLGMPHGSEAWDNYRRASHPR
jgi:hypothetical protein